MRLKRLHLEHFGTNIGLGVMSIYWFIKSELVRIMYLKYPELQR